MAERLPLEPHPDELVRLNIAARQLGVVSKTIRKYIRCNYLRGHRLPSGQWRVYRWSLARALDLRLKTRPNRSKLR